MYLFIAKLFGGEKYMTLRSSQNLNISLMNVSQTLASIQKTQVQILAGSQHLYSPNLLCHPPEGGAGVGHRLAGNPLTLTSLVPRPHPAVHVEESLGVWATPRQYC